MSPVTASNALLSPTSYPVINTMVIPVLLDTIEVLTAALALFGIATVRIPHLYTKVKVKTLLCDCLYALLRITRVVQRENEIYALFRLVFLKRNTLVNERDSRFD